ncbi:hypothetical protein P171DRAFT_449298 [Karstenula rhodostoma CBS 690.94]|uniref:Uncharacterized protein n=1 Tax=Karstenula rhodostoma CBS 690.94 TaxID=1392251 RepID=A0A9P4P7D0_9PLEO|nr:hypothetical protein P171DRAFT_449298 [Karstenula rhodostoma CBS 690.94]
MPSQNHTGAYMVFSLSASYSASHMESSRASNTPPFNAVSAITSIHANWQIPPSTPSLGLTPPLCPPTDRYFPEAWPVPLLIALLHLSELTVGERHRAMWYLEKQFTAKVNDSPYTENLGLQVADVQAAVTAFSNAAWQKETDHKGKDGQFEHPAHTDSKGKLAEGSQPQEESAERSLKQEEEVASRKRKRIDHDDEQDQDLDIETASSRPNIPEKRKTEYRGYSRPAPGNVTKDTACYVQEASTPMLSSVPSFSSLGQAIISLPQRLQHKPSDAEQELEDRAAAERKEKSERSEPMANIRATINDSEAAYRQEEEIICTGERRKSTQDDQLQALRPEAVTLKHPSPELGRVKSARTELEAAHGTSIEEQKKIDSAAT